MGIVLNLIITGIPSILKGNEGYSFYEPEVLNLIITGIPSIPEKTKQEEAAAKEF